MLNGKLLAILFGVFLYTHPLLAAEDTKEYANVDGWSIRVDTSLNNGCFLFAEYEGGTMLRLGYDNKENTIYVLFGDGTWESIEYGKKYEVEIQFGNEEKWNAYARGWSSEPPKNAPFLWVYVSDEQAAINTFLREFMQEQSIRLFYNGNSIASLKLKGSFAAATKLAECQKVMSGTNSDPFKKPPTSTDPFSTPASTSTDPFKT